MNLRVRAARRHLAHVEVEELQVDDAGEDVLPGVGVALEERARLGDGGVADHPRPVRQELEDDRRVVGVLAELREVLGDVEADAPGAALDDRRDVAAEARGVEADEEEEVAARLVGDLWRAVEERLEERERGLFVVEALRERAEDGRDGAVDRVVLVLELEERAEERDDLRVALREDLQERRERADRRDDVRALVPLGDDVLERLEDVGGAELLLEGGERDEPLERAGGGEADLLDVLRVSGGARASLRRRSKTAKKRRSAASSTAAAIAGRLSASSLRTIHVLSCAKSSANGTHHALFSSGVHFLAKSTRSRSASRLMQLFFAWRSASIPSPSHFASSVVRRGSIARTSSTIRSSTSIPAWISPRTPGRR